MAAFGVAIANDFSGNDGGLEINVTRRMDDGELIKITYDWNGIVLDMAYELLRDPSEMRPIEILQAKGFAPENVTLALSQSKIVIENNSTAIKFVISYENQFNHELDQFYPGWRRISFKGKIDVIKAHQKHIESMAEKAKPWWRLW